jgi:PII-like signaling protein
MSGNEKEAVLLRIYVRESEQWEGKPLHVAIVEEARNRGLAGATVFRGIEGTGLRKEGQTTRDPDQSPELPLVIEIVDWEDKTQSFLKTVEEMVEEGLVTTQKVQVVSYRSRMSD